jgi:hypothetical protein
MVRNESVRFGRHIDIEVRYKILRLEVPKLVPILHYPACFQKGLLEAVLSKNTLRPFRVKTFVMVKKLRTIERNLFEFTLNLENQFVFLILTLKDRGHFSQKTPQFCHF